MNKEIKYILFLIAAVIIAGLVYFLVSVSNKPVGIDEVPVVTNNVVENIPAPVIQ